MAPIAGVVEYLQGTGTGKVKLDIIERIAEEHADSKPLAFVTALIQHGSPINKGTINKVQVYFGMIDAPEEVEPSNEDLDEIADDPFNADVVDGEGDETPVKKSGKNSKKSGKKSGKKKAKKKGKKKKAKKKGKAS